MQTREGWSNDDLLAAQDRIKASANNGNGFGLSLAAAAAIWPTATATDANGARTFSEDGTLRLRANAGPTLTDLAANWPSPASRDWKGENGADHMLNGTGRLHLDQLPNFVAHCFTPPDQEKWISGVPPSTWRPISRRLFRSATSSTSQIVLRRWLRRGSWRKRRLNPWFVEWLMGWPAGHALCDCSATESSRFKRDMRGALSALPMASGRWIWKPRAELTATQMNLFGE